MTPIAGAISGVISYGVGKDLTHTAGKRSWEWLFLIEGVCTVGFALILLCLLPGMPDTVADKGHWMFRSRTERDLIMERYTAGES